MCTSIRNSFSVVYINGLLIPLPRKLLETVHGGGGYIPASTVGVAGFGSGGPETVSEVSESYVIVGGES